MGLIFFIERAIFNIDLKLQIPVVRSPYVHMSAGSDH